jgi:type I restriction enzyme, S subunit
MKNWVRKKIAEISTVFEDGDWIESKDQSTDGIRLIQTGNVGNGIFKDRGEKARYISEATFKRLRCTEIFEGDCLISRLPDPVGRACILPDTGEKMITAVDCTIIRFDNKQIIPNWFLYYSLSNEYQNEIQKQVTGATRQRISRKNLGLVSVPVAPLPEQQRIVSILHECFTAIEKAKANAEQNLKNAKELFESYLQGVFEKKGAGWEEKKLGEVVNKIMTGPFGSMLHQSDYVQEGIPVVNPQNIVDGKIVPLSKTMINQDTFSRLSKYALMLDDIVIARRGEMGRCAVVRQENVNWLCGTGSFVIRVNPNKADSNFLNIILSSNSVKQQLEKSSIGATMSNLNQTILSELPIRIPTVEQQQTIVRQLDALRAETQKLEAVYQKKIADLEELKKSILQKAFAGELNSPEGAEYDSEAATPLAKKSSSIKSPEGV